MSTITPSGAPSAPDTTAAPGTTAAAGTPRYHPDEERFRARTRRFSWIAGISTAGILVLMIVVLWVTAPGITLDPRSQAPLGGQAIAEVLRSNGVEVQVTSTLDETVAALPGADLLLLSDPEGWLFSADLGELEAAASGIDLLLIDPYGAPQSTFAPGVLYGGLDDAGSFEAGCALPAAVAAGTVEAPSVTVFRGYGEATVCFPTADDPRTGALIQLEDDGRTVTVLGPELFSNDRIDEGGNAALALWLLGEGERVVWYQATSVDAPPPPTFDPGDLPPVQIPDDYRPPFGQGATENPLARFIPPWLIPAILLLLLVAAAAGLWRGRRLGPLVTENLPVTPRANETMEGRALLYRRSRARLRSLDALRLGSLRRIAPRLGLPRSAGVDEIAEALGALLGIDRGELLLLLRDRQPTTDAGLVHDSDALLRLEHHLAARLAAGDAPGRMDNR